MGKVLGAVLARIPYSLVYSSYVYLEIAFVRIVDVTLVTVEAETSMLRLNVIIQFFFSVDCELAFFTFEFL